jgi:hypothetical protein
LRRPIIARTRRCSRPGESLFRDAFNSVLQQNLPIADLQPFPGADGLEVEILAGGLLAMVKTMDAAQKEARCQQGSAFRFAKLGGPCPALKTRLAD